ncbi:hypothetical protein HDV00_012713 [Rhizophlyctis rosea]|nr:hypothetical protein HDV00_012713 [Rhizophlyctis rosea]
MEGGSVSGAAYSSYLGTQTSPEGITRPLSPTSLPYMASATKLLATLATLQLVESGKLSLDKDLRPELPELTALGILIAYDDTTGEASTTPMVKPLTLRQMLTHSGGMDYFFFKPLRKKYRAAHPPPKPAPNAYQRFLMPGTFQRGEGWIYSHSVDFAGYLVEVASGLKLDEYLRKHIFAPVGVPPTDITYFPVLEGHGDRMPDLNPQDPGGLGLAAVNDFIWNDGGDACYGGQGAYVTMPAYVAVLESILKNDGKILGKEMRDEIFKPQLEEKANEVLQTLLAGPYGGAFGQGTSGKGRNHGLGGLLIGEDGDGGLGKGSLLWGGGHNTVWFIDPTNGICGIASPQLKMPTDAKLAMELKGGV